MDQQRLKVALSMATFVPGGMGGSETYARELVKELVHRPEIDLSVLVAPAASGVFGEVREVVLDRLAGGARATDRLRTLAQTVRPGRAARAELARADVVHYPFTVPLPANRRQQGVITLLDLQHHEIPEMFSRQERVYRRFAYDRPARTAARVITISEFAKQSIVERLAVPADMIDVAPLGVDSYWFERQRGSREDFAFYPATAWPHKNHDRLIRAIEQVRRLRPAFRLVLTGGLRDQLGILPDWVEHRGYVEASEIRELYRRASCLAFPSLYEGFGLPPLEAMAAGCPVVVARTAALPEVCGDAAVYVDPESVESIALGIEQALARGSGFVDRGMERARTFTWGACADRHLDSYRKALLLA